MTESNSSAVIIMVVGYVQYFMCSGKKEKQHYLTVSVELCNSFFPLKCIIYVLFE